MRFDLALDPGLCAQVLHRYVWFGRHRVGPLSQIDHEDSLELGGSAAAILADEITNERSAVATAGCSDRFQVFSLLVRWLFEMDADVRS